MHTSLITKEKFTKKSPEQWREIWIDKSERIIKDHNYSFDKKMIILKISKKYKKVVLERCKSLNCILMLDN